MADMNWTAVLTALIGGAAGAAVPLVLHFSGARREKESVRAAILAEISSLADIIERRGYEHDLWCERENLSMRLENAPSGFSVAPGILQVPIPADYNLIYRQNCQRLGLLKPGEASQVVHFYQLLQSVVADITPGGVLYEGTHDSERFTETLLVLNEAIDVAVRLVSASDLPPGVDRMWTYRLEKAREPKL